MSQPVLITGLGAISAIGNTVKECYASLLSSKAGIGKMRYLRSVHSETLPVAEVKQTNEELAAVFPGLRGVSRTALLSLIAAKEALQDAGITVTDNLRIGFISANTVGGMDKTENFFKDFLPDNSRGRLKDVVNHECGSVTELVADQLGIRHYVSTVSTACSSSANAIFHGARMIRQDQLDVVIAGGADALTKFTLNGFNTLMILDDKPCKPFDENRKGLNLGEGAAYVVMVSKKYHDLNPSNVYCRLSGFANANDAYHQTASSPDGTGSYMAMEAALKKAGLRPEDIGYINLHGTGTQNNDIAEGTAISRLFAAPYPAMSSTKSYTGHTLGACGSLEAVFSILALTNGVVYPNLRLETTMKDLPFQPVTSLKEETGLQHVLSNSFGFGGNCSSLIFSKL